MGLAVLAFDVEHRSFRGRVRGRVRARVRARVRVRVRARVRLSAEVRVRARVRLSAERVLLCLAGRAVRDVACEAEAARLAHT